MLKKKKKTKHKKSKLIRFVIPIDISTTFLLIICVGKGETGFETVLLCWFMGSTQFPNAPHLLAIYTNVICPCDFYDIS